MLNVVCVVSGLCMCSVDSILFKKHYRANISVGKRTF